MRARRCFVQFIHPGGQAKPRGEFTSWNRAKDHARKFLKARGRYIRNRQVSEGNFAFWGEWEPESRVVARISATSKRDPRFLHEPFYLPDDGSWRQNTDPFVFGDRFLYTGCKQHKGGRETQLRHLEPGSVILFGSCVEGRFALDTCFVADDECIDHSRKTLSLLRGRVPDAYWPITIYPWYLGNVPDEQVHRLYFGSTPEHPRDGMFSFVPCQALDPQTPGFRRPEITIDGYITPTLPIGQKFTRDITSEDTRELWREVIRQVEGVGLALGVYAEIPESGQVGLFRAIR